MKPSAGVVAAGVVALLGSVCVAFFAVRLLGITFFPRVSPAAAPSAEQSAMLRESVVSGALFQFGFALWGLATGIGLLRLRPWARISVLVFAIFLALITAFMILFLVLFPLPGMPDTGQHFGFMFRMTRGSMSAVLLSIVVWWLILFTRKGVVAQFSATPSLAAAQDAQGFIASLAIEAGPPRLQRPLFITILAWFFVISALMGVPSFFHFTGPFRKVSFPFLWTVVSGSYMTAYMLLSSGLVLAAGIALLKNKIWGYWLAFGYQVFVLLNVCVTLLAPGHTERLKTFMASIQASFPPGMAAPPSYFFETVQMFGLVIVAVVSVVILWFLWSCRARFFEFASLQARSTRNAQ